MFRYEEKEAMKKILAAEEKPLDSAPVEDVEERKSSDAGDSRLNVKKIGSNEINTVVTPDKKPPLGKYILLR